EVYKKKLESKLQQNNIRDMWSGMKKITGFKQMDDRIDGYLDRAHELNILCYRFSSEMKEFFSTAHSQTDIPPPFHQNLPCHTSNVLSSISAMDPSASTSLSSTKSEDADDPFSS
ncbi:hypothetical protein CHARACLAT_028611, partial [Characodon lateralis]|nr:hypothetical protein [Characodon lateralis]